MSAACTAACPACLRTHGERGMATTSSLRGGSRRRCLDRRARYRSLWFVGDWSASGTKGQRCDIEARSGLWGWPLRSLSGRPSALLRPPACETLPWHLRYGGFEGILPTITGFLFRVVGFRFLFQIGGSTSVKCLYTSSAASPFRAIVNRNTATGVAESLR